MRRRSGRGFWSWAGRLELFLLKVVVMGFVIFFMIQAMFIGDPLQRMVTVFEGVEGLNFQNRPESTKESINFNSPIAETEAEITLALVDYSSLQKAKVLVNGEVKGNFLNKYVSVNLHQGDLLEVDGKFYTHSFKVKLIEVSPALAGLKQGQQFTVKAEELTLGEIQFKTTKDEQPVSIPTPGI